MPMLSHVRSEQSPAIAWQPADGSSGAPGGMLRGAAARTPQLHLTRAAILAVDAHLSESTSPLPFGLLVGALCVCPPQNLVYLLNDAVIRSRTELSESDPYGQLASELRSLVAQQEKHGKSTIGWYLGGMADDLTVDSDLRALHREIFPEPWHVLLLRGEADGIKHGAILRFDGASDSAYPVPFFEVLPEREVRTIGERRTAIRWKEYRTLGPSLHLSQSEVSTPRGEGASPSRWGTRGLNASFESFRQGSRSPSLDKLPAPPASTGSSRPQERSAERAGAERAEEHQHQPSACLEEAVHPSAVHLEALASAATSETRRRSATTPLPSQSESRARVPPNPDVNAILVEHTRPSPIASIEASGAGRASAPDLQHIFFNGTLVPVRWERRFNRKARVLVTFRRAWIAPLLVLVPVLSTVAALSWLAR
jgi:hypothetical protein